MQKKWHHKLRAALEKPLKVATHPTFTRIMIFCKADSFSIFPKSVNTCAPNAMFGQYFQEDKCRRSHALPSDEKVLAIVKFMDPFIKEPNKVASGR